MWQGVERWVAEQNIIRFRALILDENDILQRMMLEGLIVLEEGTLKRFETAR